MSRWFRHYAGMMRDEKLVRVAIKSKQPIERVLWVWGAILESAAEIDQNGRYDLDAAEVAYFLRADQDDVDAVLTSLADAGRVDEGCVVNWGARQFQSDRSATRQAAYRERQRGRDGDDKKGDASVNSDGDKVVTSPDRHGDAPETETETETETEEHSYECMSNSGECDGQLDAEPKDLAPATPSLKPEHVVETWNTVAKRLSRPCIRDLTPERRQLVRARIGQYTIDDFVTVFGKVESSAFLRGDLKWQGATFDWIMKKANFQKTLEGNYDQ